MKDSDAYKKAIAYLAALMGMVGIVWAAMRLFRKPDGVSASGVFEQGEATPDDPSVSNANDLTFQDQAITMQHFDIYEFDSPDELGSGKKMHLSTLSLLDRARTEAGIAFHVNSGYRTAAHNAAVGGVTNSAHRQGYAADIRATTESQQIAILKAAYKVGFRRFGVYNTFIHMDNDPAKPSPTLWHEGGTTFNPMLV